MGGCVDHRQSPTKLIDCPFNYYLFGRTAVGKGREKNTLGKREKYSGEKNVL